MKNNKGFSLVELIVVIAIMAILIGVAVPVYSSYVEKSQKAADIQLVDEIIHALQIAAVGDNWYQTVKPGSAVGAIVLTPDSEVTVTGNVELLKKALSDTFGTDYTSKLKLSYDGWNVVYKGSSFEGSESELLKDVDTLTGVLKLAIQQDPTLVGDKFKNFLLELDIAPDDASDANLDKIADAAVLYVSQQTSQISDDAKQAYVDCVNNIPQYAKDQSPTGKSLVEDLIGIFGNPVTAASALYAAAEGYCMYEAGMQNPKPLQILREATLKIDTGSIGENSSQAVSEVLYAFAAVQAEVLNSDNTVKDGYNFDKYFQSQAEANSWAYLDVLSTVNGAKSEIVGSLGSADCFTSQYMVDLFGAYSKGGVFIVVEMDENGTVVIDNPLE
jgi:type IV pilus assembly protein PilA